MFTLSLFLAINLLMEFEVLNVILKKSEQVRYAIRKSAYKGK